MKPMAAPGVRWVDRPWKKTCPAGLMDENSSAIKPPGRSYIVSAYCGQVFLFGDEKSLIAFSVATRPL